MSYDLPCTISIKSNTLLDMNVCFQFIEILKLYMHVLPWILLSFFAFVQFLPIISSDILFIPIYWPQKAPPVHFACYWRILNTQLSYKIDDVTNVYLSNVKKTFFKISTINFVFLIKLIAKVSRLKLVLNFRN